MGYTHYFTRRLGRIHREPWAQICEDVRAILTHAQAIQSIPLANGHGEPGTQPKIDDGVIAFNGVGEDSHETFYLTRRLREAAPWEDEARRRFDFCKTAHKPYDMAVTAVLCYLSSVAETHTVTSDGDARDWTPGLEMARLALPHLGNRLDYPRALLEEARWTGPWITNPTAYGCAARLAKAHPEVRFCVDGRAYVMVGDRAIHRWETHQEAARWLKANAEGGWLPEHVRNATRTGDPPATTYWEPNIWTPTGAFDQERWVRLAKWQKHKLLALKSPDAPQPPALVRPGDFPQFDEPGAFAYSVSDLIARHSAMTAMFGGAEGSAAGAGAGD